MGQCEYCLIHEEDVAFAHEVDHILSLKHGGGTAAENLAYACFVCNRFKGSDLGSVTPDGEFVRFFHPREQNWADHFRLDGAIITPLTPQGEATGRILRLNSPERVLERMTLQQLGRYPRTALPSPTL